MCSRPRSGHSRLSRRSVAMSLCSTSCALVLLLGLVAGSPVAIDDSSNDTSLSSEEALRPNLTDQTPVGRTFLLLHLLKSKLLHKLQDKYATTVFPFRGCLCVPFYLCDPNGTIISDGGGVIDPR